VERIDLWWSEFYARAGLVGFLKIASGSSWFDKQIIDGVVDGTAMGVRHVGQGSTGVQTGRLQDYLAGAIIIGLSVFGMVWFFL